MFVLPLPEQCACPRLRCRPPLRVLTLTPVSHPHHHHPPLPQQRLPRMLHLWHQNDPVVAAQITWPWTWIHPLVPAIPLEYARIVAQSVNRLNKRSVVLPKARMPPMQRQLPVSAPLHLRRAVVLRVRSLQSAHLQQRKHHRRRAPVPAPVLRRQSAQATQSCRLRSRRALWTNPAASLPRPLPLLRRRLPLRFSSLHRCQLAADKVPLQALALRVSWAL